MSADLNDLASYVRPLVDELITQCFAIGIPVRVICTLRDLEDEQTAIVTGHSWLTNPEHSKHLPHPPEGKSEAADIAPIAYLGMPNWNPNGPAWDTMGKLGKRLGLVWGGDWIHINAGRGDPSHFEWSAPKAMAVGAVIPGSQPSQPTGETVPLAARSRSPFRELFGWPLLGNDTLLPQQ